VTEKEREIIRLMVANWRLIIIIILKRIKRICLFWVLRGDVGRDGEGAEIVRREVERENERDVERESEGKEEGKLCEVRGGLDFFFWCWCCLLG
jgi:hypothetical protein